MKICAYGSFSEFVPEDKLQPYFELGERLGKKYDLVYGGGDHSTLGALAKGMAKSNAKIMGVYPDKFEGMSVYDGCTEIIHCKTMGERKAVFENNAEIFLVLPGGVGTLDELFEAIVLIEKHMIKGKVIILNYEGFYDTLLKFMDELKEKGMFHVDLSFVYDVANTLEEAEAYIEKYYEENKAE